MASVASRPASAPAVEVLKRGKSDVYRLHASGSALIAKRSAIETSRLERTVYRDVLARLPLPHLECIGWLEEGDRGWLFLEDAGEDRLTASRRDRQRLGRWLARLHSASRALADVELPPRGVVHYIEVVAGAGRTLERGRANHALTASGRRHVEVLLQACSRLERNVERLETLAASFEPTLVHGGLAGKNVRFRGEDVLAFDWEAGGWGFPVTDLALADPDAYLAEAGRIGMTVEPSVLEASVSLGRALWCLAAIPGEEDHLVAPWASRIDGKLDFYACETEAALLDGGW